MIVIPAREVAMDGTSRDAEGFAAARANRAVNVNRGVRALEKDRTRKGRIAIVGYGPSLNDTWERLREFETIWTVSKAHDFLIDRGIVPTYHTDVDMREHKAAFMRAPHPDVRYIMATSVHPAFIDKLLAADADVSLFHVGIDPKELFLDRRYPTATVRFDAGLQAAELAFQRGYWEQHWFGIEYGTLADGQTHAGPHEGVKSAPCLVDVDGVQYGSTAMFFHGLLLAEDMLCKRALLRCTIHGRGLLAPFLHARGRVRPARQV